MNYQNYNDPFATSFPSGNTVFPEGVLLIYFVELRRLTFFVTGHTFQSFQLPLLPSYGALLSQPFGFHGNFHSCNPTTPVLLLVPSDCGLHMYSELPTASAVTSFVTGQTFQSFQLPTSQPSYGAWPTVFPEPFGFPGNFHSNPTTPGPITNKRTSRVAPA